MTIVEFRTDEKGVTECHDSGLALIGSTDDEKKLNLKPHTSYIGALWPLPDGYRLLTEEEKQKYKKNDLLGYLMHFSYYEKTFNEVHLNPTCEGWVPHTIYVIREDWTPPETNENTVCGRRIKELEAQLALKNKALEVAASETYESAPTGLIPCTESEWIQVQIDDWVQYAAYKDLEGDSK